MATQRNSSFFPKGINSPYEGRIRFNELFGKSASARGRLTGRNFNGNGLDHRSRRLRKPRTRGTNRGPIRLACLGHCGRGRDLQRTQQRSVGGQSSGERRNLRIRSPLAFPLPRLYGRVDVPLRKIRFRRYGGSWFRHLLCSRSYDRNRFGHGGRSNGGYPNRDAKKQCRERHHRLRRPAFSPSLLGDWVSFITKQQ